jgi:hypothetical protein
MLTRFEFGARSGKHQHDLIVREATVQDGLEDVVDHAAMITNDGPDIDPLAHRSRFSRKWSARKTFSRKAGGIRSRAWTWRPPLQWTIGPDVLSRLP